MEQNQEEFLNPRAESGIHFFISLFIKPGFPAYSVRLPVWAAGRNLFLEQGKMGASGKTKKYPVRSERESCLKGTGDIFPHILGTGKRKLGSQLY
jgi:hypothetical protein